MRTINCIVIPADFAGAATWRVADADNLLEFLQAQVNGHIEAITVRLFDERISCYLNEDGKNEGLPVNTTATLMFRNDLLPGDYLVGNVVLLGLPDSMGNDTSIPERFREFVDPETETEADKRHRADLTRKRD